ncbi:hypothetical protein HHK36_026567 [Tetracentron sinense]|uniref:DRBM domain-containing protein n=1 Tax=Tetracentron sinense TaxID=13715 RepID=A0A834YH24_TETSI|nr:hypothetical protein HHK36_026567 [Tetracentron sinense]
MTDGKVVIFIAAVVKERVSNFVRCACLASYIGMYKNQLQELAQRSCFNLPSYACIREGPDHAPRFKATVNFNGEIFESPAFCTTLRQAEHAAAEVALSTLSKRGPSRALAARVLDETGVYKNLLQETAHRAGLNLPVYTTVRSGPGHVPIFSCTVELAGMIFAGEPAKTKKQAQKNAAMAAWSALKQLSHLGSSSPSLSSSLLENEANEEQEQVIVARVLAKLRPAEANQSRQNNDQQRARRRSAPVRRDTNPPGGGVSLYSMPHQSWVYSNFPPELAMYQMWQQEQASRQQSRLLTLSMAPTTPPGPRILPFIQSIFQPDHGQYFPAREQQSIPAVPGIAISASDPSLYLSNRLMPLPVRSRSQVTIQEIQEEKTHGEGEWLHVDASSNGLKVNIQSNASGFSPFEVPNPPLPDGSRAEPVVQEMPPDEDKEKNFGSEPKTENSVPLEGNQTEHFEWASRRCMDTRFRPGTTTPGYVEFQLRDLHGIDSSQRNLRTHHPPRANSPGVGSCFRPPSSAAPVMIRTVGPISSRGPRPESLNTLVPAMPAPSTIRAAGPRFSDRHRLAGRNFGRMPSVSFMAPAVQIRSVVPVCSAPPMRKMQDSSQEKLFSGDEKKTREPEDVPTASSELGKLQI